MEQLQVVFRRGFVIEMQDVPESRPTAVKASKVLSKGNARQLPHQIVGVFFAIIGSMEDAIDIIKDVIGGDGIIAVVLAKLPESLWRDVVVAAHRFRKNSEENIVHQQALNSNREHNR